MPSAPLFDRSLVDPKRVVADIEEIRRANPQRYELEQLSHIAYIDADGSTAAGVQLVPEEPWWARGHVPGRPLMPGVLMLEAAAQLCSFAIRRAYDPGAYVDRFFGFGGIDDVKFRWIIVPGDTLVVLGKRVELRPRRAIYDTQGWVDDRMCFEARITGMWV
jgi:3-hydroxyacyl-[acyl-carrier-protein] dehydratase